MNINFERLPEDVLHIINIDYDDDDDPDKGGQGILGKKSKSNMKKEKGEIIPLPYSGKPKDNDDDDKKGRTLQGKPRMNTGRKWHCLKVKRKNL